MTISYSQRDMEWADDRLGNSPDLTLGQAGCLVTAIASTISDITGRVMAPGELNLWLRQNGGFTGGGLFLWDSIATLGLRRAETIPCISQPAPVKHLAEVVTSGAGVVVEVDSVPDGPVNQHWVRLLALDEKDGQIMDPWQLPGRELTTLSRYFAAGWTPARAIFMAVVYSPVTSSPREIYQPAAPTRELAGDGGHQPALCIRAETSGRSLAPTVSRGKTSLRRRARPKPQHP